jgi:hypothetical protein
MAPNQGLKFRTSLSCGARGLGSKRSSQRGICYRLFPFFFGGLAPLSSGTHGLFSGIRGRRSRAFTPIMGSDVPLSFSRHRLRRSRHGRSFSFLIGNFTPLTFGLYSEYSDSIHSFYYISGSLRRRLFPFFRSVRDRVSFGQKSSSSRSLPGSPRGPRGHLFSFHFSDLAPLSFGTPSSGTRGLNCSPRSHRGPSFSFFVSGLAPPSFGQRSSRRGLRSSFRSHRGRSFSFFVGGLAPLSFGQCRKEWEYPTCY